MIFRIFATLVFIAIVAGSLWLGSQQRESVAPATVETASAEPGYSARKAELIETGPDGLPMYTVNADVIRQRPGDGVDFEQVRMSFRDNEGKLWNARADQGQLGPDTNKVELMGNVHVEGLLPGSPNLADLATERLSVDTRADTLSTDDPVTLTWGAGRQLKAGGLSAALKERHMVLKSSVHGTFSP